MTSTHILETACLRVEIADAGAELCRVFDRESGLERLWSADPAVWNRHAPILFPFVGKLTDGKYRVNGREYPMKTQHGFARDMDFTCTRESAALVEHRLCASEATRAGYPFDFALTVRHCVDAARPRTLRVAWTVENTGDADMLYAIGGHPGFLPPEGVRKEDCALLFPGCEELVYFSASPAGFALPEQKKRLALCGGAAPYQADVPDTWIFEEQGIDAVAIAAPGGQPYVTLRCPGFPLLAVWANAKGPFICLEPWFGRTDDAGFTGSIEEKRCIQRLAPGGVREYSYEIDFH